MNLSCRVISPNDLDEIINFETSKLAEVMPDETERALHSWHARWRRESLEHYLTLGWSFLARTPDDHVLIGYFLGQAFSFVDGMTQTLWIEHLSFNSLQARDQLCELATKLAREKHFQKVIFPNQIGIANSLSSLKPEVWAPQALAVSTTKI
ncbi:MAG: hypothetical protein IPK04_19485 [Bdellovibrionales bacterium]|jgi:hypothetical protein|nr:hypothetical protein [Bdellovibrionales bacterium]